VTICPVNALEKRADGIVDVDPRACIGCKACMQGCPYDALYLNDETGTAQKCHFCAHRTERGLAPACAVVCPTEAIIPGDFHDPASRVSRMLAEDPLVARKVEAGTGPNVYYKEVGPAGIDPLQTNGSGGYLWSDRLPGIQLEAEEFTALEQRAGARTVYDVPHPPLWGWRITAYLLTKSCAAGAFLAGCVSLAPLFGGAQPGRASIVMPLLAVVFLALTSLLLVLDLKRPERFYYILVRGNWSSWLVRGTWALAGYGALLSLWLFLAWRGDLELSTRWMLGAFGCGAAALSASYTGWLFAQAKGRVLWMKKGLWAHLIVQAGVAGSALVLIVSPWLALDGPTAAAQRVAFVLWLALHTGFMLTEGRAAPTRRELEYARVVALVERGPFAAKRWGVGILLGVVLPVVLTILPGAATLAPLAGVLALVGLWADEDVLVRAGQALPIS
jgi:ferredoxin/formate-dependent nitrite reductase membrane component NrfD